MKIHRAYQREIFNETRSKFSSLKTLRTSKLYSRHYTLLFAFAHRTHSPKLTKFKNIPDEPSISKRRLETKQKFFILSSSPTVKFSPPTRLLNINRGYSQRIRISIFDEHGRQNRSVGSWRRRRRDVSRHKHPFYQPPSTQREQRRWMDPKGSSVHCDVT